MRSFFSKDKISAGLDIGSSVIKAVKLKIGKDAVECCGFDLAETGLDLSIPLKKIKQSLQIESVNISFSGPSTVIRNVSFPKMNQQELMQALKFEAQKHIPFSVDQINLDAHILKEDLPDNKMLVLIAGVKKELLAERLKAIEEAGLKADIAELDSLALANAFNFNYPKDENLKQKAAALLNIGSSVTNLVIIENEVLRLSRDIQIAGASFTQKIMDTLGVDFKTAENLKINPGQETSNKVNATVEAVLMNLSSEARTSFDYYESQNASSVAKIFISGGGSLFKGLKDMLANLLGIEAEYWNPFEKISLAGTLDAEKLKLSSGQLNIAAGLAMRT